jgi:adenine-specific DNA-methyltransferase
VGLTLSISKQQISGKDVFFVNGYSDAPNQVKGADLIACFAKNITDDLVKQLAQLQPLRIVFRDYGFGDGMNADAVKINAEQIFKQLSPTTDVKSL